MIHHSDKGTRAGGPFQTETPTSVPPIIYGANSSKPHVRQPKPDDAESKQNKTIEGENVPVQAEQMENTPEPSSEAVDPNDNKKTKKR